MKLNELLMSLATNIRVGHATNSSSTHSIVLLTDRELRDLPNRPPESGDLRYGWDHFTLTTKEQKLDYLWVNLWRQIAHLSRPGRGNWQIEQELGVKFPNLSMSVAQFAQKVASAMLQHTPRSGELHPDEEDLLDESYIDHQSEFSFPLNPKTLFPDVAFVRWFREQVLHPNVAILGGNDNSERPDDMPEGESIKSFLPNDEHTHPNVVYDRQDHWLLWDKENGLKLRVPKVAGATIRHTNVPELVDIKVTDQCHMGCAFCYQGSTPDGENPKVRAYDMATMVEKLGVLEAAIGGGEPLEYPDFWELVGSLNSKGVTVNVTTRRPELIPVWKLSQFGGIGYSVESPALARRTFERLGLTEDNYDNPWKQKLVLHLVLGAAPTEQLIEICRLAAKWYLPVLLLGYKEDGRGSKFGTYAHEDWIEKFRTAFYGEGEDEDGKWRAWSGPKLGVDTPIVERWGDELQERLRVNPRYMVTGEGMFSLYVDFVAQETRKASYHFSGNATVPFCGIDKRDDWKKGEKWAEQALIAFRGWHERWM